MSHLIYEIKIILDKETKMMPGPSLESSDNGTDDCPDSGFEFNDYQNFWNSALGVTTMTTNLVFCFLTTLLAVSL